mgnify:CR=1 FL=1
MNLYWSAADLYWSTQQAILVDEATYIGSPADQYSFAPLLYGYGQHLSEKTKKSPRRRSAGRAYNAIARPQEP